MKFVETSVAGVIRIEGAPDIVFSFERIDHPAGCAFVKIELRGKAVQRHRPASDERIDGVALSDRYIVTTNAFSIPVLVSPYELRQRFMKVPGIAVKRCFHR